MISIVAAYHNRKDIFIKTLESLKKSEVTDYEIILVDDCSDDHHRVEDLIETYPNLKVIRIEKEEKWWINPCVTYNIGFKHASGDIIVIQNPECKHMGDVLKTSMSIEEGKYFTFACYSIDKNTTYSDSENILINNIPASYDGELAWYNHSIYRPKAYHFCSVITRKDLDKLGGFDEKYAYGIAYDDDEFLHRIKKLDLQVSIIDYPFVVHQWHERVNYNRNDVNDLISKNYNLYFNYTTKL